MRQYEMCEITLQGEALSESWADAAPEVVVACGEAEHTVKGFYAGNGEYRVRFLPEIAGEWTYRVTGPVSGEGSVTVEPAREGRHGIVRAVDCHFEHQDGTMYYPFGTTIYAMIHQDRELVEETFRSLEAAPFNKVRLCVFPKHYDFNHNEPEYYAFEKDADGKWDVSRPCFAFWDLLDEAIERLGDLGIEADLILFHPYDRWGFSKLTQEESLTYLSYAIRRLSAYPNLWWSMANEYDFVAAKSMEDWHAIDTFISENDPWGHLLSNHNCFQRYDFTRETITHCSIQTKAIQRVREWRKTYRKPVCIDECCYEGNIIHPWGSISATEMTYRFWRTVAQGGYCTHGETFYSDDEILWWARGGKLKGESPARIGFLRELVESLPGPIEPLEGGLLGLSNLPVDDRNSMMAQLTPEFRTFVEARLRMSDVESQIYDMMEDEYAGHVGEEAYLTFFDLRTCAKAVMNLPEDHRYQVELIDVMEMTRTLLPGEYSGKDEIDMPGKEGMALLATRID